MMVQMEGMALTIEKGTMYRMASATMPNQKLDVILLITGTSTRSIHACICFILILPLVYTQPL